MSDLALFQPIKGGKVDPTLFGIDISTIGSTIAVIGTLATCVVFIIKKQRADDLVKEKEVKIQSLQNDIVQLNKHVAEFKSEFRANPEAFYKKDEIEKQLNSIIKLLNVEAGSIYIPSTIIPDLNNIIPSQMLIFLAKDANGKSERSLVDKLVPMDGSAAGACFKAAKTTLTAPEREPYYKEADEVSGFKTKDILNIYLACSGQAIGVLQLINKKDNTKFSLTYADSIKTELNEISNKIYQFISESDNLKHIRIKHNTRANKSTIMFCDLTNSSLFYKEYGALDATAFINEYIDAMSSIALKHGAAIDNYMGDGIMLSFNVDKNSKDNPLSAVEAALCMIEAFDVIKKEWAMRAGCVEVSHLFVRIGISYGDARYAAIGHYTRQKLSLFGCAVINAAQLCEVACRNRNVILIDSAMQSAIVSRYNTTLIESEPIQSSLQFSDKVYMVEPE
jgi:class 3 adenylate cyclase